MAKNDPAFPKPCDECSHDIPECHAEQVGLTKRELFAAMAMQGLVTLASFDKPLDENFIATVSVKYADALIAELEKDDA